MISILPGLEIPEGDLEFVASRSGGPGGQNVNKVSSRVTLRFDLERTTALSPEQRSRIRAKLASRINKDGILKHSTINHLDLGRSIDEVLRLLDAVDYSEEHGEVCPMNWKKGSKAMKPTAAGLKEYVRK